MHLGVVACADQDLQRSANLAAGPRPSELGAKKGQRLGDMLPMQVHKALAASAARSLHQKDGLGARLLQVQRVLGSNYKAGW